MLLRSGFERWCAMTVLEKIEFLMAERKMNKRQLSINSKIPYSTISNLWVRGSDSMRLPTFRALCDFFGVTMDSMAWDENEIVYRKDLKVPDLSREERDVVEAYKRADEGMQRGVRLLLKLPEGKNNTFSEEYLKNA